MLQTQNDRCIQDLIISVSNNQESEIATIFLDHHGRITEQLTYYELKARCTNAAQQLLERTSPGDVVLVSLEDQVEFVIGFFACLLCACIPAPIQAIRHQNDKKGVSRVRAILEAGEASTILLPKEQLAIIDHHFTTSSLKAITIESLLSKATTKNALPKSDPNSIAYIQYTSGSTNHPKGVCLTHNQVLANLEKMYKTFQREERVKVVGWLPFHHDMGLVGHLFSVLYETGLGVFLPPASFLSDPNVWLQAMHDFKGTIAAVPAFAVDECVRRVDVNEVWDLRSFKHLYVGSETVSYAPLIELAEKLKPTGFSTDAIYPVYGLAEATLLVAGGDINLTQLIDKFVDKPLGKQRRRLTPYPLDTLADTVSIRDRETGERLADGNEGEIVVTAPYVFSGYYKPDHENLSDSVNSLHTGDVGYIVDGTLYITGRCKEVIIVRGVNYHAEDLECSAQYNNDILRSQDKTACVSHIIDDREQLIVFQEINRHIAPINYPKIVEKIQANLLDGFTIKADEVHLIPTGLMPKTRNHKISRNQCMQRYLSGELTPLYSDPASQMAPEESDVKIKDDPVVIVGMACRFPGGADDLERFWDMLCEGNDGISRVPPTRWDNSIFFDRQAAVPGKVNTKWSGFIDDIDQFDPSLFGISPYEAPEVDPQQRMLLESSWRLLEHTGWKKEDIQGSDTGVFVGISNNDYLYLKIKLSENLDGFNAYSGLGNANSVAANRLSYFYDLKGPSLAVDTACSSSLTAFNYAVKAILEGECDQAIAGGVNAIISPGTTVTLSQFGMMSPKGRCKAFDKSADGYVRAEGCGLVMLKRRSAAVRDGDNILAVVKGSVAGQDGRSAGITFPNGDAQRQLIKKTLEHANVDAAQINYIEAHGTGTPTGDPVEVAQLASVYGAAEGDICHVGSVKANIGHLESAAGIAGLIKVVLMLNRHRIPAQLHFSELNPRINIDDCRLSIPTDTTPWEAKQKVAAISSFGFGRALAHAILAQPQLGQDATSSTQAQYTTVNPIGELPYRVFMLSHHSAKGLKAQAQSWVDYLTTSPEMSLDDLCYTQAHCRTHLNVRKAFVVKSHADIKAQLEQFIQSPKPVALPSTESENKVVFLLTGQGARYLNMGRSLYENVPLFRAEFDRCAQALSSEDVPQPLAELAFEVSEDAPEHQRYQQVIQFAIQYALGLYWQDCGVTPHALLGHSLGEYAAACLAGCFEPEVGMKILLKRSELVDSLENKGKMLSISASSDDVLSILNQELAQVAVLNTEKQTVIAGCSSEIARVEAHFNDKQVVTHELAVPAAFHCHLLDPIVNEFRDFVAKFTFLAPSKPWISSTSAALVETAPNYEHWVKHLREQVKFSSSAKLLDDLGINHFLEIGPGASTLFSVNDSIAETSPTLLRSFCTPKGGKTEASHVFDSLAKLYESGWNIHWQYVLCGVKQTQQLPGLVFEQQRYWLKGLDPANITAFAGPIYGVKNISSIKPVSISEESDDTLPANYDLTWVERQTNNTQTTSDTFRDNISWILFGPDSQVLQSLRKQVKGNNHQVFWVSTDKDDPAKYDAQILSTHDASLAFDTLNKVITSQSRANTEAWKVVYIPADKVIDNADLQIEQLKQTVEDSLGSLIVCLKALRHVVITPPVWIATCHTQQVSADDGQTLNLGDSPIWGFAKTLFLEHPEWRGGMIDFDVRQPCDESATTIMSKVLKPGTEHCVAFRNNSQYIEQLTPAAPKPEMQATFRDDGAFIITGGLGGLGLKTAQWVIEKGAKHLILMSRKSVPPKSNWGNIESGHEQFELISKLKGFQAQGVKVEIASQDVRDLDKLESLFNTLNKQKIPVRGIIHAAGVNWFSKIMELDSEPFFDTLDTKIAATWKLHTLSQSLDLDCFILYSSVSALWGSVNLSHYTAANFFLDTLSLYRNNQGLKSLSLNWGPWAEVGMSAKPEEEMLLGKMGFTLMPPPDALTAMEQEMMVGNPLSLIGTIDWGKYQSFIDFTLQPSLFEQVTENNTPTSSETDRDHLQNIFDANPNEARALIREIVEMELRSVMLIESVDEIPGDKRFNFLGMDSLMAILLATKLEQYFKVKLSNTMAYNYPHINAVSEHLFERVYLVEHPDAGTQNPDSGTDSIEQAAQESKVIDLEAVAQSKKGRWFVEYTPITEHTKVVLFCFPYTGSGPLVYRPWADHLESDVALIGIQPPGKDERSNETPYTSMKNLIDDVIDQFEAPNLPFIFYGHSLGALMAYESAVALSEAGKSTPIHMVLSGCNAPSIRKANNVHKLPDDQFVDAVLEKYQGVGENLDRRAAIERTIDILRTDIEILETYQPANVALDIPLSIIAGQSDPILSDQKVRNWVSFSKSNFEISYVFGGHNLVSDQSEILITKLEQTINQHITIDIANPMADSTGVKKLVAGKSEVNAK